MLWSGPGQAGAVTRANLDALPEHAERASRQGPRAPPTRCAYRLLHRSRRLDRHRPPRGAGLPRRHHLSFPHRHGRLLLSHGQAQRAREWRARVSGCGLRRAVSDGGAGGRGRRLSLGPRRGGLRRLRLEAPAALTGAMAASHSESLFGRAQRVLPGGVNSPVRAFRGVGGTPFFVRSAEGSRITDVDGRSYIDFLGSWGPLILGHAAPAVIEAVGEALARGTSYGAPTPGEVELADLIVSAVPSMEMVRLVSSGTEAAMSAIRLARGATGRDLIIKFEGCYHGHADSLLVKAGSGGATFGVPDSLGVPEALARMTLTAPFNDLGAVERLMDARGGEVAVVIVEPVAGNMGVVPPATGFLEGLRRLCDRHGALLLFDEVITGFRLGYGGAQARYGVRPDLTCLGKIIGGGLPVGAYGGPRALMERISPLGGVYQAGTLSGNPLAVAAGLTTLRALADPAVYERLERAAATLEAGLVDGARASGIPLTGNRVGSMLTAFFTDGPVTDYASAKRASTERYARFFHAMLARGVFLAASQFEAAFVSLAHSYTDLEAAARAAREALATLR